MGDEGRVSDIWAYIIHDGGLWGVGGGAGEEVEVEQGREDRSIMMVLYCNKNSINA